MIGKDDERDSENCRGDHPVEKSAVQVPGDTPRFPVVGLGASAGGLEALEAFYRAVPEDCGMAFIVVMHQSPNEVSLLPELLQKCTRMPVVPANDGVKLAANQVYIAPPGAKLELSNGRLRLSHDSGLHELPLPIDFFFRSLAADQKERAVAIVLSGTGTDGSLGVREIKALSGVVMVEDPESARFTGMPTSAIATGTADYVLPPDAMPDRMLAHVQRSFRGLSSTSEVVDESLDSSLPKIIAVLRRRTGHDFSRYKSTTIRRRIERRMHVHQIDKMQRYLRYLGDQPDEIDKLFAELLIGVTTFFRDPEAFEVLAADVIPQILASKKEGDSVRVWIPACSTGEEAYSIAIVLHECMDQIGKRFDVQIFSSDLDRAAIDRARTGIYPSGIAADISPHRLARFFIERKGVFQVQNAIREMVVFAPQNLISDPPFSKLDLISCRNLLIYLEPELQKKVLSIFHFALNPEGYLLLGSSETIGDSIDFRLVHKKWKVFRRIESAVNFVAAFPLQSDSIGSDSNQVPERERNMASRASSLSQLAETLLAREYVPPSVICDQHGKIVHIHGRTGQFLEYASGTPRNNIIEEAREGLKSRLVAAIRTASGRDEPVVERNVRVGTNGGSISITLTVWRIAQPHELSGLLAVVFEPDDLVMVPEQTPKPADTKKHPLVPNERIEELEHQLQFTRESLQATIEEAETANEELKATNEELQSTNEELQSTNEELETSKEELQSLNEEILTINAELECKIEDLSTANDDMSNLLNSTEVATVFLSNELKVKRFTESARNVIKLIPSDVGRPVADLASALKYDRLVEDATEVLKTLKFKEFELQTHEGHWYLLRILPYRTSEDRIDGVVLTFLDVDRFKLAELYADSIVQTVREPLLVLDTSHRVVSANSSFYRSFNTNSGETEGRVVSELGNGQWNIPQLRDTLSEVARNDTVIEDFRVEYDCPGKGTKVLLLNARKLRNPADKSHRILLAIQDITGGGWITRSPESTDSA